MCPLMFATEEKMLVHFGWSTCNVWIHQSITYIRGIPKAIEIHFLNKLSSRALAANFLFSMLHFARYAFECDCVCVAAYMTLWVKTLHPFNRLIFFLCEREKMKSSRNSSAFPKENKPKIVFSAHIHVLHVLCEKNGRYKLQNFIFENNKMMLLFGNLFILVGQLTFSYGNRIWRVWEIDEKLKWPREQMEISKKQSRLSRVHHDYENHFVRAEKILLKLTKK